MLPDTRQHRGPHPDDAKLFGEGALPVLQQASGDLSWLLSRGYADISALKLVGDRYALAKRQRVAVGRCACGDAALAGRSRREIPLDKAAGRNVAIDGFNLLITLEAALGGAVLLVGRDGCLRDMAGLHGSYRKVAETPPAIDLAADALTALRPAACRWLLDRPVSNSGRLKSMLMARADRDALPWSVELVNDPDGVLATTNEIVVTADSAVLDRCGAWLNLAREIVNARIAGARQIAL